jgi:hypothetical protein
VWNVGPLSLASAIEELLGRNSSGSGLENREYGRRGSVALTTRHSLSSEVAIVRWRTKATELVSRTVVQIT